MAGARDNINKNYRAYEFGIAGNTQYLDVFCDFYFNFYNIFVKDR